MDSTVVNSRAAVVHVLPYMEAGGTERHVLHLMDGLQGRFRFGLLAPSGPSLVEFVGRGVLHRAFPRLESTVLQGIAAFRRGLRSLIDELEPSLIHVHAGAELALLARAAARRARIPIVLTLHGFAVNNPESNFKIANKLARWARVERIITVSEAEERLLAAAGFPKERIRVVHNGIPDLWEGAESPGKTGIDWRTRCGWPPDAPVVGAVGRLDPAKGFDILLEAFARLKPTGGEGKEPPRLVIVGDGSEGDALRRRVQALGIGERVHFAGHVSDGARAPAGFDVAAVPSRQEALPLACLEAMAAGTPVVGSDVGGLPEAILSGETGFVVPPDDVDALAAALQRVLDAPDGAHNMGRRARQRFLAKFRLEVMVENTLKVYEEVMG